MKKYKLSLLMLFLISILATTGSAENELIINFEEITTEVEAGTTAEYSIEIMNYQGERDIYRISYNDFLIAPFSDFAESIVSNPSQVKLNPLEKGKVKNQLILSIKL